MENWSKIGQETKVAKIGNDVIVRSILKIAQQFFCVSIFYSYLLMYQVTKHPRAENDQKSPGRIG